MAPFCMIINQRSSVYYDHSIMYSVYGFYTIFLFSPQTVRFAIGRSWTQSKARTKRTLTLLDSRIMFYHIHHVALLPPFQVRNEAENFFTDVEQTRDRVRSAGSTGVVSKRTKKIKQTQSWADYATANSIGEL